MYRTTFAIVPVVAALGLGACGGSDKGTEPPVTAAERSAVAQLKYCMEGAGALTAKPGVSVPELGKTPTGPDVKNTRRVLVIFWASTKDSAEVYYAASERAAEAASHGLGSGVRQQGNLIVVPDSDHPPAPIDEGLLIEDCLP